MTGHIQKSSVGRDKEGSILEEIVRDLPVSVLLLWLSIIDLRKREVPHSGVLALFFYSLVTLGLSGLWQNISTALAVFFVLFAVALVTNEGIGGGDIKLITVLTLYLGEDLFLLAVPMAILLTGTLIWVILARKGLRYYFPFVPYIFLSFIVYLGGKTWFINLAYQWP